MKRNVEVQNVPAIVFNHEEATEGVEAKGWQSEEVEAGNRLAMVIQKGESLGGFHFSGMPTCLPNHGHFWRWFTSKPGPEPILVSKP